jgi:hypothetical protein
MITNCKTKTITEVEDNKITISCICSENQNDVDKPTVFRSDILKKEVVVNKTPGVEGELFLTHTDSNEVVGKIDQDGNLIMTLDEDDVDKYYVENQNLMYDGQ